MSKSFRSTAWQVKGIMYHCLICGDKSRMFSTEDDLLGHMHAQHRNWLKSNVEKEKFISENEDDILTELNAWLIKGNWQSQVSLKRPWYTEPEYHGPKTLLENTLKGKRSTSKEIQLGQAHRASYENVIQEKETKITQLQYVLEAKSQLTEDALDLATETAIENVDLREEKKKAENKISWTQKPVLAEKLPLNHTKRNRVPNYPKDKYSRKIKEPDTDDDPLEHLFEGLQLQINRACEQAKSLKQVSHWRQKQIHKSMMKGDDNDY